MGVSVAGAQTAEWAASFRPWRVFCVPCSRTIPSNSWTYCLASACHSSYMQLKLFRGLQHWVQLASIKSAQEWSGLDTNQHSPQSLKLVTSLKTSDSSSAQQGNNAISIGLF